MQTSTGMGGSMETSTAKLPTVSGGLGRLQELNIVLSETVVRLRSLRVTIAGHSPEAGLEDDNPIPSPDSTVEILWRNLEILSHITDTLNEEIGMIEVRTVG